MADVGRLLPGVSSVLRPPATAELGAYGVDLRGRRVADIGTGDGRLALGAAREAKSVIAIDPDAEALARGRAEAKRLAIRNTVFRQGAAQSLDLPDGSIDVALLSWTL
jgi:ubiquinone/menaquinone biosynthesis C-methylase UbiE